MGKRIKRVFIICNCKFPRGGALSNYIQYLSSAILLAGYETIIISDINSEYIFSDKGKAKYGEHHIECITVSNNKLFKHIQYRTGFAYERFKILRKYNISRSDVIVVLGQSKIFYNKLLKYREKIGFKIIGGLLEMFAQEDFGTRIREYKRYNYVLENIFPQFDAIMPISTYIEKHYKEKGLKTFCIPIMADSEGVKVRKKY